MLAAVCAATVPVDRESEEDVIRRSRHGQRVEYRVVQTVMLAGEERTQAPEGQRSKYHHVSASFTDCRRFPGHSSHLWRKNSMVELAAG